MSKREKSRYSLSQHTSPLSGFIQNLKILALIAGEKSVIDFYEKEKWTNKENDKHEDAHLLLHNITSHTQCLYQISKS